MPSSPHRMRYHLLSPSPTFSSFVPDTQSTAAMVSNGHREARVRLSPHFGTAKEASVISRQDRAYKRRRSALGALLASATRGGDISDRQARVAAVPSSLPPLHHYFVHSKPSLNPFSFATCQMIDFPSSIICQIFPQKDFPQRGPTADRTDPLPRAAPAGSSTLHANKNAKQLVRC
ncbi:hypothetical protein EJ06DRAFT_267144 [Trichodelitschia bisporula]|uniref:Uncharacterized protein n=1 Tax=Trichodelitschia bisporula TaxID=703511 RepID=A0A6G1HII9_9PEZI|nr:hypothetical protein EJ06DRAFT_267144 [Trichodelitschia bisporula]